MTDASDSTDKLAQAAASGGMCRLSGTGRSTAELVRIAAATAGSGGTLTLTDMRMRPTDDLVEITRSGEGSVNFEF